ncbi:MAG: hypothetical protein K0U66_08000 [Gammaproteobacteria bacterium]|nr:hypothetical protein [Gammaproteobacteria bacterium]
MRVLSNYFLLGLLHFLGAVPLARQRIQRWTMALYYIAILGKRTRKLNRLTMANIKFAFPDWDDARHQKIYRLFWQSQIYAMLYESPIISAKKYNYLAKSLQRPPDAKNSLVHWTGLEHIESTRASPVIFTVAHMHSLEVGVIATSCQRPLHFISKDPKVKFFARVVQRNRDQIDYAKRIDGKNLLSVNRCLAGGGAVLILGDQYVRANKPISVQFFNAPIEVQPTISRLAWHTKAKVIPVYVRRTADMRYEVACQAPLELSDNDHQYNSQLIFSHFEKCIRACPEQYIWNHNRFFR